MRSRLSFVAVALLMAAVLAWAPPAAAQFGKLKDKVKDKVERKVDQKTDQTIDKAIESNGQGAQGESAPDAPAAAGRAPTGGGAGSATAEDMTLYTKYDFVPGDKVLFFDDLSREEMGEFPSRWNLEHGVFEIAKSEGRNWILCTDKGTITPKVAPGPLPDRYTAELDFHAGGDKDGWYWLSWRNAEGEEIGRLQIGYSHLTSLEILNKRIADKELPRLPNGRHVLRIMATKSTIKCYVDQERVANVPKVEGFVPVGFAVTVDPYFENTGIARLGDFRYAEGGKTLREQLDEAGRIVTHGILFDSGSDRIRGESYKTLTDIGTMLADDSALRLSIEGHTDADGAEEANLKLSQARAAAVRAYLMDRHGLDGGRLETKGLGESKPIDGNDTPEGKANNRRVELVRI